MTAADVYDTGIRDVIVATGARYRRDGVGRNRHSAVAGVDSPRVFTPDDLMDGRIPSGHVAIYDDDHYYMASVLADLLVSKGCTITWITHAPIVSYWSQNTLEQERIEARLLRHGARILTKHDLVRITAAGVEVASAFSGDPLVIACDAVLLVTDRTPNDALYQELREGLARGDLDTLRLIGDAEAPSVIAQAVYAGHLAAREFDEVIDPDVTPFQVERVQVP